MKPWLAGAAVAAIAIAVFAPTIRFGFTGWDDTAYVVNNPAVTAPEGLERIWASPDSEQYYPLTFSSYRLEYRLWGATARGYHATNVLLHAIDALLVLVVLRAIGLRLDAALVGAILFAVHPLQVMSVAWIAERKNLLACAFVLLALAAWTRAGARSYALALAAFCAALLSKTSVLLLPFALALFDALVLRRGRRATLLRAGPMLLLSLAAAAVTLVFEQKFVDRTPSSLVPGLVERIQIAGAAPWFYLGKVALPVRLSPAYPLWSVGAERIAAWLPISITLVCGLGFLALLPRIRNGTAARAAWLSAFTFLMLAPSLGLIPYGNLALTYASDHLLYLSMPGIAGLAGLAFAAARARMGRTAVAVACCIAAAWIAGSLSYARVFRDARSLWTRVVAVSPDSYGGNLGLAEALSAQGDPHEAAACYERAIGIRPAAPDAYLFLGQASERAGDPATAALRFQQALERAPGSVDALVGLAWAAERSGKPEEARRLYEQAIQMDPRSVPARMGLGAIELGFGRPERALPQFDEAIELRPDVARAYLGAATALRSLGRHRDAAERLRRGLARAHDDPALLNLLALTLATTPDDGLRDGPAAVALAERACAVRKDDPDLLDTLAAALAAAGRFDEAFRTSLRADEIAPGSAERMRRTALYRADAPLRLPAPAPATNPLDQAH